MYETADMMNKRRMAANLIAEARAGRIPETPEGHNLRGKPAPVARKAAIPTAKKAAAPVARKSASSAKAISASFRDTLEKTERDIIRNKQRLNQLENDINAMQRMGAPEFSILMVQKKKDREEVRGKIEKLQGIRDRCRKQLGMK